MEEKENETSKSSLELERDEHGRLLPGQQSLNPLGRPKGKTMKEYAREYFALKSDDEKRAYIEYVEGKKPGFAWEMGEGRPAQDLDIGGKDGQPIQFVIAKEVADKNDITPQPEQNSG